jgi:hypothetical protein
MTDDELRTLATMQSSINLLAGIIEKLSERLDHIEFHQKVETQAWKREAINHHAEAARDLARNAEGLRTMDIGVSDEST